MRVNLYDTAETVSGANLRDALTEGYNAALAECARVPVGFTSDIEKRLWYRGYDALACEPLWLESNR
jgi:hypothetical protein